MPGCWQKIALIWLVLLLASNTVRLLFPADDNVRADKQQAWLAIAGQTTTDHDVRLAYLDTRPADNNAPVVVLLHGSPAAGSLDMLIASQESDFRVIAPDLPGFGDSSLRVPDYSISAHADYVYALLDTLDISAAHLIAYSMGGGVALNMYATDPSRILSVSLISSIGVQELELFGEYHLNHAVHQLQFALITTLEWGLPHFGYLDDALLNTTYARNFLDSDQRPLRAILEQFDAPMLIVHGHEDRLVPLATATEHHRIVPQSELIVLEGGHGMIFRQADELGSYARDFIAEVENGDGLSRLLASPQRIKHAAQAFDSHNSLRFAGVSLFVLLVLLAFATYISEDLACIAAGLLVAKGALPFWPVTLACMLGIYTGDVLLYWAGKHLGKPMMQRAPLRWLFSDAGVETSKTWFQAHGPAAILASRFVPGARLPTYLAAGVLGTSFWKFSVYILLAAVVWTPLLVGIAATIGIATFDMFDKYRTYALPLGLVLALLIFMVLRLLLPLASEQGRRLLLGRWRRLTRRDF